MCNAGADPRQRRVGHCVEPSGVPPRDLRASSRLPTIVGIAVFLAHGKACAECEGSTCQLLSLSRAGSGRRPSRAPSRAREDDAGAPSCHLVMLVGW